MKLDYDSSPHPPGALRRGAARAVRTLLLLSLGVVLVIFLPIGVLCLRTSGGYREQFERESALMRTVLLADQQTFGRVTIDEASSTGMAGLYGTVPTEADRARLVQMLTPHFGPGGAQARVKVEPDTP